MTGDELVLCFQAFHLRGGVERIMVECSRFLARRGYQVHVVSGEIDASLLPPQAVPHLIPRSIGQGVLGPMNYVRGSTALMRTLSPGLKGYGAFGVLCPPGGVVWIQSVHAAWLEISQRLRPLSGRLKQKANPFHYYALHRERWYLGGRHYRRVIALTEQVKQDLMRLYRVPEVDIDLLPNGFSPQEFNLQRGAERAAVRQRLGYQDEDRVVIWVGNELERKGYYPLLEAIRRLQDPTLRLLVVGRMSVDSARAALPSLGLEHVVQFAGSSGDLGSLYAAADVMCLPTQYEAWGLVLVEALACGLPVVTSRLAGAAVAVQHGTTGYLLENPLDIEEIQHALQSVPATPRQAIASSVLDYRWDTLLPTYERIILGT